MFTNDPKLNPRLPSPTSFDGVKPSYVEWSAELLTYLLGTIKSSFLSFRRSQVTKMSSQKMFLSKESCQRSLSRSKNVKIETITSGAHVKDDQDAAPARVNDEIKALQDKKDSTISTLMKADDFLRYVLLHSTSGDPNIMARRIMGTASSIKITLPLQNVRGPLANALSLSINEKPTWNDILAYQLLQQQHPHRLKRDLSARHLGQGLKGGFSESSRQKGKG